MSVYLTFGFVVCLPQVQDERWTNQNVITLTDTPWGRLKGSIEDGCQLHSSSAISFHVG